MLFTYNKLKATAEKFKFLKLETTEYKNIVVLSNKDKNNKNKIVFIENNKNKTFKISYIGEEKVSFNTIYTYIITDKMVYIKEEPNKKRHVISGDAYISNVLDIFLAMFVYEELIEEKYIFGGYIKNQSNENKKTNKNK